MIRPTGASTHSTKTQIQLFGWYTYILDSSFHFMFRLLGANAYNGI